MPISDSLPVSGKVLEVRLLNFMFSEEELKVPWFNELICTFIMANIPTCFLCQKILLVSTAPVFSEEQSRACFLSLDNHLIFIHIVLIKPSTYLKEAY